MKYFVTIADRTHEVELVERLGELVISVDGEPMDVSYDEVDPHGQVVLRHKGASFAISIEGNASNVGVTLAGHYYGMQLEDERERAAHLAERAASKGGGVVKSVMPGVVVEALVQVGDVVEEGQSLLILEAMKMQNEIAAPSDGTVGEIFVAKGVAVNAGAKLLTIDASGDEA